MYNPYEHAIVITNRTLVQGSFLEQMEKVVCLHPQGVILRERDLSDEEYEALAEKVLGICAREKVSWFPALPDLDCQEAWLYRYPSVDSVCAVNVGDREGRTSEELCTSQHFLS